MGVDQPSAGFVRAGQIASLSSIGSPPSSSEPASKSRIASGQGKGTATGPRGSGRPYSSITHPFTTKSSTLS